MSNDAATVARQRVAAQILPIIFGTSVSRAAVETEPVESIPRLTAQCIADNVGTWVLCGDWVDRPLTEAEIDDAELDSTAALTVEVASLRAQLEAARAALRKFRAARSPEEIRTS